MVFVLFSDDSSVFLTRLVRWALSILGSKSSCSVFLRVSLTLVYVCSQVSFLSSGVPSTLIFKVCHFAATTPVEEQQHTKCLGGVSFNEAKNRIKSQNND